MKYYPYSYSKLNCYTTCPQKFKFKYIDNIEVVEDNAILEKGTFFHHLFEHFPNIPPKFDFKFDENLSNKTKYITQFKSKLDSDKTLIPLLKKYRLFSEKEFFLDSNFNVVDTKEESMIYGYIDYLGQVTEKDLIIIDWKTGKSKGTPLQLYLYLIWAFRNYPLVDNIKAIFYYIEQENNEIFNINRNEYEDFIQTYQDKINTVEDDSTFKKKTNKWCDRCGFYSLCKPFKVKGIR
jgi:CRISPR/Cas system-associated exonuclease Cas4 (RecB family)